MAQQVEHVLGKDEVTGSSPVSSSMVSGATCRHVVPFFISERSLQMKAENYKSFILSTLKEIMSVDSPTGFSAAINQKLTEILSSLDYAAKESNKRLIKVSVPGNDRKKRLPYPRTSIRWEPSSEAFRPTEKSALPVWAVPFFLLLTGNIAAFMRTGEECIRVHFYPILVPVMSIETRELWSVTKIRCMYVSTKKSIPLRT